MSADVLALHFEQRCRRLDEALRTCGAKGILEIASGLSFRGLAMAAHESAYYLDTDLPEMAATTVRSMRQRWRTIRPSCRTGPARIHRS